MHSFSLNIRGRLLSIDRPMVMGVINATPDSFHAPSRAQDAETITAAAKRMAVEGADIIDVGACSTRPGSQPPDPKEELQRAVMAIEAVRSAVGDRLVSIDTYRAEVARAAVEAGADIVNDISAGRLDKEMFPTIAALKVPYILTHSRLTPADMDVAADYGPEPEAVAAAVAGELSEPLHRLRQMGVADVIVDPGFGFAKTPAQCYALLAHLGEVGRILDAPMLVGLSRKSMITKLLNISAEEALPATIALNAAALLEGAAIIRVHDVAEGRQTADAIALLLSQRQIPTSQLYFSSND